MSTYILGEPYARIPNRVLLDHELSPYAKLCFTRILQYANKDGHAFPKLTTLAEEFNVSVRHIQRALNELKYKKLIVIQRRGMGLSNVYIICSRLSTRGQK